MLDNIDPNLLKNGEIFDFDEAANTYFFPIDELIENHFQDFIETKINGEFINLRKHYANKEFQKVRDLAHKLKSVFSMLGAARLHKSLEQIQKTIDNKELDNVKEPYILLIKEMGIFIRELQNFSDNVNYPIDEDLIQKFNRLTKECDQNDNLNKSLPLSNVEINSSVTKNNIKNDEIIDLEKGNVQVDNTVTRNMCCENGCIII